MPIGQAVENLKSVHDRHPVIQDEAARLRQIGVRQQFIAASEGADGQPLEFQCELEGFAHGQIVIDDQNDILSLGHYSAPAD